MADQPQPKPNSSPAIVDLVLADIRERDILGRQRYGTRLQAHNGRDGLRDAYEESLDKTFYLRLCIEERDRLVTERDALFETLQDVMKLAVMNDTSAPEGSVYAEYVSRARLVLRVIGLRR